MKINMKQGYRYNSKGEYVEPIIIEDEEQIPEDVTLTPLPQPNWKPIWNKRKKEWVETITDEELEELQNPVYPPTETQQLAQQSTELELQSMEHGQQITEMELTGMLHGQQMTDMQIEQMLQGQMMTDFELRLFELEVR